MKNKSVRIIIAVIVLAAAAFFLWPKKGTNKTEQLKTVKVALSDLRISVIVTGNVQPQNRLEIKPPVAGRVEKILVVEGDYVKKGQTLALLSSTDRAALLDAARAKGEASLKEWEDTYKPIPVVAPLAGEVIVRSVEPGQSVAASDAVIVLSDRLIVRAQVDETDIGKVKKNQAAVITLDAYPGESIRARVDHISYESKMVNNVTTYYVDILPASVPAYFRSGMSANVEIIQQEKTGVLTLPVDAVKESGEGNFVLVPSADGKKPARVNVTTGMTDGTNMEIVAGLKEGDNVFVNGSNYVPVSKAEEGTNPFMPKRSAATRRAH
ncbi:MAG: efflux RND transporter periplasmic adaptor subunit [Spirochaetia bacterium]|nr:efflux RND transporter periplasmic adaptor subunit [Spirochaetia bacterium]